MLKSALTKLSIWLFAAFVFLIGFLYIKNRALMADIRERLLAGSQIITTPNGDIEYALEGNGPAVLLVHATGGGYDQGLYMGHTWVGTGYTFIAPSRFGYLRTPAPEGASPTTQADLFNCLLDSLGVQKVAIVAMSAGGPSAMQYAIRYPERVAALVLMSSAAYAPPDYPNTTREFPSADWIYNAIFNSDFLFGLLATYTSPMLEEAFGATKEIKATLGEDEKNIAADIVQFMLPITARQPGLTLEKQFVDGLQEYDLQFVTAPTLVISARDDKVGPYGWGEYTASCIPGAQFILYDSGGHMLLGNRAKIAAAIDSLFSNTIKQQ